MRLKADGGLKPARDSLLTQANISPRFHSECELNQLHTVWNNKACFIEYISVLGVLEERWTDNMRCICVFSIAGS